MNCKQAAWRLMHGGRRMPLSATANWQSETSGDRHQGERNRPRPDRRSPLHDRVLNHLSFSYHITGKL